MYSVVCDSCGKPDRVPFKPSSDKPIYCSECFETKGGKSTTNVQMTEINEKLDRILAKLEA
jgi:CxxC-x17-CxxC domain-containing protein